MASGGVGSCNGVSVGGVGNNNGSSSSSTSAGGGGGRTADPMGVAKAVRLGRFLFFSLGVGRIRTLGILARYW